MGVKLRGVKETIHAIGQFDKNNTALAKDVVKRAADFMVVYAKKRAPFKKGHLETSIRIAKTVNSAKGVKITVVAGFGSVTAGGKTRNVDYADIIERGGYNPGPGSIAKNASNTAAFSVGPGFMRRSFEQVSKYVKREIPRRIALAASRAAATTKSLRGRRK